MSVCVCVCVLLVNRHQFWWFGHSYSHTKPHVFTSLSATISDMLHNQHFAQVSFDPICLLLTLLSYVMYRVHCVLPTKSWSVKKTLIVNVYCFALRPAPGDY